MPVFGTTARSFGAYAVNRATFRSLLPDDRWLLYAAGWVDPKDANQATVSLVYEKNDQSIITIGSVTQSGSGRVKKSMGPFDLFATAGVPNTEDIVIVRLQAVKNAGADGQLDGWGLWVRHLKSK